jgi:aerobic-type carbon monoxide dehydrogenase small subunit (CoxS/CutS family)
MASSGAGTRGDLNLTVNGSPHHLAAEPHETLLEVLRERLNLMSVREACGVGICGSCTVLVDKKPMSACLLFAAQVEGRVVVTLEAMAEGEKLHPVQEAFLKASAFQCSFCTPGFILSVRALLEEVPNPSDDDVRAYLAGNLCRCGSYVKVLEAVKVARKLTEETRGGRGDGRIT